MDEEVTALHLFARYGNDQGVALMLQAGAEADAEALSGLTPLLEAAKGVGENPTAERVAAACACCRLLVEAGADTHHVGVLPDDFYHFEDEAGLRLNDSGFSALTCAVDRNVPALASTLVELGADFTQCTNQSSYSLLMHAALDGKMEVLSVLLAVSESLPPADKEAFVNMQYRSADNAEDVSNGGNVLHLLCEPRHVPHRSRIAKLLIKAGVSVLARNAQGRTPLEAAVAMNRLKLIKVLEGSGCQ